MKQWEVLKNLMKIVKFDVRDRPNMLKNLFKIRERLLNFHENSRIGV